MQKSPKRKIFLRDVFRAVFPFPVIKRAEKVSGFLF